MKRMVKNGDLIDVEPDGSITVAGKPIGGGENEREITLTMPYSSNENSYNKKLYIDDETWNKINSRYYETIKFYYNDGNPIGVFHVVKIKMSSFNISKYSCIAFTKDNADYGEWYGTYTPTYISAEIKLKSDSTGKYLEIRESSDVPIPKLQQSKFDALYKLADKPTQDGTYVLKATVSGGAVTYTWVAQ